MRESLLTECLNRRRRRSQTSVSPVADLWMQRLKQLRLEQNAPITQEPEAVPSLAERVRLSNARQQEQEAEAEAESEPEQPTKGGKAPPPPRDWAWYLTQIKEAKADKTPAMMHPSQLRGPGLLALGRHVTRWNAMSRAPGGLMSKLKVYVSPHQAYRQAFIKTLAFERENPVEPEIPTGIVEVWRDKGAVADQTDKWRCDSGGNVLRSPDTYMRLTLPPGQGISELLLLSQFDGLPEDDYRIEDIIHVQRRHSNRELKGAGVMAAEVDAIEEAGAPWWIDYLPHVAGILLPLICGFLYIAGKGE